MDKVQISYPVILPQTLPHFFVETKGLISYKFKALFTGGLFSWRQKQGVRGESPCRCTHVPELGFWHFRSKFLCQSWEHGHHQFWYQALVVVGLPVNLGCWDPGLRIPLPNLSFPLKLCPNKADHVEASNREKNQQCPSKPHGNNTMYRSP